MNNFATFPLCILEEIGFEGLEGVTLEGLWKRISVRIKVQLPLREQIKKQIWDFILGAKCLRFYLLPEEREPLKLFDRTEATDPFFGGAETENCPYTVYKYNPISTDTIRGSCEHFETRQERSKEMFKGNSVDDIEKEYGRRLVIVASQSLRDSLLLPPTLASDVEITILSYCVLERLGRARFNGELAQGTFSLSDISGDPVAFHFQKKKLLQNKLIECQSYNQHIDGTNIFGQLIHLPRFSAIFKPRHIVVLERIIEILKSKPNFMAEYQDLKSNFDAHTNSFLRRFFKSSFFQKYVLTDTRLPYRAVYPNATEKEWKTKNSGERTLHVLQLKDPNIDPSEFYIQKEITSDDENETDDENINRGFLDVSQEVIGISLLHQIYEYIKSTKAIGASEQEIGTKFGQSKLSARALVRKLSKQCKLEFYTVNRQRQNVRQYVLPEFNMQRKRPKTAFELSDDEQRCSQTEETSDLESTPIKTTLKTEEEEEEDPSQSEITVIMEEELADDRIESQADNQTGSQAEDSLLTKVSEQIDGEIITSIKEIKQSEYCRKSKKRPISDELISERNKSRVEFMVREIKTKELFDDPTKLFMALKCNEETHGATDTMCKKTFYRLLTYMCSKQLIRLWNVQFQFKSKYRSITFVTSKSIDASYSLMTSCIDQARSKFQLNIHDEMNRREAHKLRVMKVKKIPQIKPSPTEHGLRINANLNKSLNYGSTPKFVRLRTLHEFLFYLVYENRAGAGGEEPNQEGFIEQLKENSVFLDDIVEQIPTIWTPEPGCLWKLFIPPLIPHNGFDEGWCLLSDCIFRMPLSIFVRTINLSYEIPGLDEYLVHPIKKHFLIKDLPIQMQQMLYERRKHITNLHDFMRKLACIGLVQIGPHRSQKDQAFYYLNRFASLYDTSASEQGLYYISDMEYPIKRYQLKSLEDVYNYWNDMHSICMTTKLNRKSMGDGNTPYEKVFPERLLIYIKAIQQRQAKQRDNGELPGDRRGAAGLDSNFFAHLERNWSFNSTRFSSQKTQFKAKQIAAPIRCNRIIRVIRDPNLKKRDSRVTAAPVPLHKLKSTIVRRRVPITRKKMLLTGKKRIYNKYDEIDRLALKNMNKLRVDWNQQEDNCLLLCKVAQMYLNPNNRLVMPSQVIRDILHWSSKSMNKTALACRRRISYITKKLPNSDQINNSILMCLNEIKENKSIQKRFGSGMIRNLKKIYSDEHELFNAFRIHFIDLVHTLSCQFYNMTNSYQSNALILPKTVQEFNARFLEKIDSFYDPNTIRYDEPETVDDIKVATIVTLIHSTMCCCQDKTSLSIQLYEIYKDFPERLLSLAMHKVRSDQLISHNKINSSTRKAHKSCLPLSSSSYHLSATYQQQMTTKISYDLFDESFVMLQEMSEDLSSRKEPHILNLLNTEVCFFITELLHKKSYDVSIEIPKRLLLLDPSKRLPDESFQGIYARFHEIFNYIPKIDLVGGDDNSIDEFLMETNNDEKSVTVNQTTQIMKKLENFPADILHIFCIIDNYGVTKPRNQLQLDDDGQCPLDCIKQLTNPFDHIMDRMLAKREVWYRLNVEQQELAPLPAVVTIDEFNIVAIYNFLVSKGSTGSSTEEQRTDNLEKFKQVSDIVDEMLLENDKDFIDEDFDADYDLRSDMKKKLYDGNQINDKIHKFHDFLCINTCKLSLQPQLDENDNIDLVRLHKKREDLLAKIVRDANWSAEFKTNEDFVELMVAKGFSMTEVHISVDIFNYIAAAGEKGASAASLIDRYEDNEFLEKFLNHLNEHKLVMKTGVCEVTFVHWKHIKPWVVNTYHLKRLERESIEPTNKSLMQVSSEPSTSKGLKRKHDDPVEVVKEANTKCKKLETSADDMEMDSIGDSSDSEMEDIVGATVTLIQTEEPSETTANEQTKQISSKHRKRLSQMSVEYGQEVGTQFASQTKKTFPLKIAPWIRVNGSINRRVLDKYAGTILLHCIENAGLTLFSLCTRFHYLLPIHVHELIEYLEGFECITKTAIPVQKPVTLFSKYESFDIGTATTLDDFKNIVIEPNIDAVTKMSIFIGRKKYKEDFI